MNSKKEREKDPMKKVKANVIIIFYKIKKKDTFC